MKNALVIDDSKISADILCKLIELLDVRARAAYGARAAILAIQEQPPDIVFVDINMPGLSGYEVLGFIKRDPATENIPVVVVTADDDTDTKAKALQEGALALLVKPVVLESLEDILKLAKIIV